jgi:hydroxymethylpyrimidine pyrophosphatase-like HAD family hydrolase
VPLRAVYTDLDGTLLGSGASLFRDGEGAFTLLAARALEACHRAGAEVVIKSGRGRRQVMEDARLLGQSAYIFEVGSGLSIDGAVEWLTDPFQPGDRGSVHEQIERTGAPGLLLERYAGRLERHAPWHVMREVTHVFQGLVDVGEVNDLLREAGHEDLRFVDNGPISLDWSERALPGPARAYHLIPASSSKAAAVARHMQARDYTRGECIAVGDSREDLEVAAGVGRFFLVANALDEDPGLSAAAARHGNVEVTESGYGEGFYEAVVRSLAEGRGVS